MRMLHPTYYVYIVTCADGTFYTGKTSDLAHRLQQHNGIHFGGAKYTKTRRPVTLAYCETYIMHKSACRREAKIKQLTREQKNKLISAFVSSTVIVK